MHGMTMRIGRGIQWVMVPLALLLASCAKAPDSEKPEARVPVKQSEVVPSAGASVGGRPQGVVRISGIQVGDLFQLLGENRILLVDVRPGFFFRLGHIPGAFSLPLKSFESGIGVFRRNLDDARRAGKTIVIYCADENCPDSLTTARKLARMGYSTSVYRGGWKEWRSSGL